METIQTGFEGLSLIKPDVFFDARGIFYESWRGVKYENLGIKENFVQDNFSTSKKNVLRGLHSQKNQGQLVTIAYGKIFDVAVDIRPESKTYKQYFSIELDAKNPQQLYMAPGFAHGFCVLSDIAIIHYKCTQYYDASLEGGIIWNDADIGITWPSNTFILNERDRMFKTLKELQL